MQRTPAPVGSRRAKVIAYIFAIVFGGGLLAVGIHLWQADPSRAAVGSCIHPRGGDDVDVVDCGDANADFRVLGRVEGKNQAQASLSACADVEGTVSTYWQSADGKTGYVLCLAKNN